MADSVAEWLARLNGSGIEKPVNRLFAHAQKGRSLTCRNFVAHAAFLLVAGFTLFWYGVVIHPSAKKRRRTYDDNDLPSSFAAFLRISTSLASR
jgi:hypothetical protein